MMIRTAETAAAVFLLSFPLIPYGQGFSGFIRNDSVRPKGYHPFQFSFRIRRPSVNGNSPLMHCVNQFACKGGIMAVQTVDLIIQFVYILNQISLFTNQFLRLVPDSAPWYNSRYALYNIKNILISVSIPSAPIIFAARKAESVFSGAKDDAPLWAWISTNPAGSSSDAEVSAKDTAQAKDRVTIAIKTRILFILPSTPIHNIPPSIPTVIHHERNIQFQKKGVIMPCAVKFCAVPHGCKAFSK